MTGPVPLTTLLSWTWAAFVIEADNAVEAEGAGRVGRLFRISLPMWANGLRHIEGTGVTVAELRRRARAACNIGGLERWGWITVGDAGAGPRPGFGSHRGVTAGTVLRPTRAGAYARRLWPRMIGVVEQRWQERFGADVTGSLRRALAPVAAAAMPLSPPEVHPPDGFRSHVVTGPAETGETGLAGLLGQALTALTLEHERDSPVSLPLGANLLRVIGDEPVRLRDLPLLAGISKEAVAMAAGFLTRKGLADPLPGRSVRLTAAGRDALGSYRARATGAASPALAAALDAIVSQRQALAGGLAPPAGCWRGEKPYLARTRRLLADPAGALPWQPMILHRGGWPDGS